MIRKVIIYFIVALGCVMPSCGNIEKAKEGNGNQNPQELMEIMAKPNQEAVTLLSLKYDLQPAIVESFLDGYLTDSKYNLKTRVSDYINIYDSEKNILFKFFAMPTKCL